MPLEPADPQRPGRRIYRDSPPGFSWLIPWIIGVGGLLFIVWSFALCSAADTVTSDDLAAPPLPGSERVAGRLQTRDALAQAQAAQDAHFEEHGTYTTSYRVLTAEGFHVGVELEGRYADETGYCVEAVHESGVTRHITRTDKRARPGPCP